MSGVPEDDKAEEESDFEALPSQQQLAMLAAAMAHSRTKCRKSATDKGGAKGRMLLGPWGMQDTDELNLAGLLNVLDGVVRVVLIPCCIVLHCA